MIDAVDAESGYEERYRFPGEYARLLFVCVAFSLGSLLPLPPVVRIAELVLFGGGAVALLVLGLRATAQVALRVDAAGLTLGLRPDRFHFANQLIPWPELTTLRLARPQRVPPVPELTANRRGRRPPLTLAVRGWKLDPDKLTAALAVHAPRVRFSDNR
jgi:hypothetical protein